MMSQCGFFPPSCSMCLCAFSIMMITASTIAPMAMAMPPSDMMFELMPWLYMTMNDISTAMGRMTMATSALRKCSRNSDADKRDDDAFLDELFLQRPDRAIDERGAVVGDGVADIGGQALHGLIEPRLDLADDFARVGAVAHDHDAPHRLAFAIQLRDATPHVGAELHVRDLAEQDRHAFRADPDRNLAQVVETLDVAAHAQDEFLLRHLDGASPDLAVALLDRHADLGDREVIRPQLRRIDRDLILFHKAADRRDFGDALDRSELIFQIPVLHRTQLGEAALLRVERIHECPANARRIRAERRGDILRQLRR